MLCSIWKVYFPIPLWILVFDWPYDKQFLKFDILDRVGGLLGRLVEASGWSTFSVAGGTVVARFSVSGALSSCWKFAGKFASLLLRSGRLASWRRFSCCLAPSVSSTLQFRSWVFPFFLGGVL